MIKPRGNETPPPIVRPQKLNDHTPVCSDMKKSILADVDKLRVDKGKPGGGV